jgi:hypothetical protein
MDKVFQRDIIGTSDNNISKIISVSCGYRWARAAATFSIHARALNVEAPSNARLSDLADGLIQSLPEK